MTEQEIQLLIQKQREYFNSGQTLSIDFRLEALAKLKQSILFHEQEITEALSKDLGKSYEEGYMCEVGLVLSELNYMLKHTKKLSKRKNIKTPLEQFPSRSYQIPSPYGVVLIMSPWNYPFMLTIDPLIDALAAGNVVSIKPSAYSPNTSNIIKIILEECFDESYVSVILGGRSENHFLLEQHFNYIFFTGSKSVGREVMKYAAHFLTPVTLELGGKSPCIVDETANIPLAAKRIVFGKFLNCGQTCVAPDYIYCHVSQKEKFLAAVQTEMKSQYTSTPLRDPNYGKIVTLKHFERIVSLICPEKVVIGGNINAETLQIEPTVLSDVTWDDAVMQDEIFGPIMPILFYESLDALIDILQSKPEPLALYYFSTNYANWRKISSFCSFGGGCFNDTIIHLATSHMGFGGVGESGMGSYHGEEGFRTFTHYKSIVDKKNWLDLPMRYKPVTKADMKLIKWFMK